MPEFLPAVIAAHAKYKRLAPIETWLTEGHDPDLRDVTMATLMHYALCEPTESSPASLPMVRLLLAHGSDPNNQPFTGVWHAGWSALHYAIAKSRLDIMVALLDSGARVHAKFLVACVKDARLDHPSRLDALRLILSRGARDYEARKSTAERCALLISEPFSEFDDAHILLRDVRLAGGWKRYANAPRASLLILRELCNRGRAAPPPELAALFCTSSDNARRTRKALPTPVFWHVLGYWRSDRDAIA
mmetsp:Transcript_24869/g.80379  ORF Transcript_24869/g.80379 Transcript_24869/m.80379 type:complete len:247 (-) Transcript_24869:28-768(-)